MKLTDKILITMKRTSFFWSLLILCGCAAPAVLLIAANHTGQSFLRGVSVIIEQPASGTALTLNTESTAPKWTNSQGSLITAGTNSAGQTYGSWDRPVNVFADASGNFNTNQVSIGFFYELHDNQTNTVTATFQRSVDGTTYDQNNTWAFAFQGDLSNGFITNVPPWFLAGAKSLRLGSLSFGTNSDGGTGYVHLVTFSGFAP